MSTSRLRESVSAGVDVAVINRFATSLQDPADESAVWLVDEIGKMECLSTAFIHAMRRLLENVRRSSRRLACAAADSSTR